MNIHLRDGSTTKDARFGRLYEADPRTRSFPVRALMPTKATKPRSYTWSIGSILDQGQTSSCVGHAVAHRLIARPVVRPEITGKDALEFYSLAQTLDPWPGEDYEGTSVLAGAKAAKQRGYVSAYHWAESLDDLIMGVGYLGPGVMGTWWWSGMMKPATNGAVTPTGYRMGGHAWLVNGVNLRAKLFFCVNSWGTGWGKGGKFVVTFEDMGMLLADAGEACFFKEIAKR